MHRAHAGRYSASAPMGGTSPRPNIFSDARRAAAGSTCAIWDGSKTTKARCRTRVAIKRILAITILALTTSGALAAHHRHHHQAMNASPVVGAPPLIGAPSPVIWPGAVSSSNRADYVKNLRESGYNPKNDYNTNGTIKN